MAQNDTFAIVGGGLAAGSAAETLRSEGFDGRVVVVAAENEAPYIRPPLSKGYLLGSEDRDGIYVKPADWYAEQNVELRLGQAATALDTATHELTLADGDTLGYDRILLATGATPRRFVADELTGIHYLRTVGQSEALHEALAGGGKRVVIVGSGWIGMEIAAAARQFDNSVTVLGLDRVPLEPALGAELGAVFGALHTEHGVDLRLPATVRGIEGSGGAVTHVTVGEGERIPADVVVVAIGAVPVVDLASSAGLEVDNGIVADAALRASAPDVYTAGDVANAMHPVLGKRLRVEHWANALNGGAAAARSMLGQDVSYDDIPYFYTDQYDLGMEYSGFGVLTADAKVVYRGSVDRREFLSFWVAGDRVVAGMNVNIWDVNDAIADLVRSGVRVDTARLADESIALEDVAAG